MSLLTASHLTLAWEGRVIASDISFSIEQGSYVCIVGENGSGKSTLLKTLLGLHHAPNGSIVYGDDLKKNEIGYLPQQTVVQKDFPASVYEIVLSGFQGKCGLRPFYTKTEKEKAIANIQRMGLESLRNRCYRELSGGQMQRVLLARALCATTKLLILDEPVSGLDPDVTKQMYELIASLHKEEKITIIMITHDLNGSLPYATHVLHMGQPFFYGSKADFVEKFEGGAR